MRKFVFSGYQFWAALLPIFKEAAGYSETSVTVYYHIRCENPDFFIWLLPAQNSANLYIVYTILKSFVALAEPPKVLCYTFEVQFFTTRHTNHQTYSATISKSNFSLHATRTIKSTLLHFRSPVLHYTPRALTFTRLKISCTTQSTVFLWPSEQICFHKQH